MYYLDVVAVQKQRLSINVYLESVSVVVPVLNLFFFEMITTFVTYTITYHTLVNHVCFGMMLKTTYCIDLRTQGIL